MTVVVGLVEGEDVFGAVGDGGLDVGVPDGGEVLTVAPEGGDEFEVGGQAVAGGTPVVGPGDFGGVGEAGC